MNTQIDFKKLSDIELKAFGYEQVAVLENANKNLQSISNELQSRFNAGNAGTNEKPKELAPKMSEDVA